MKISLRNQFHGIFMPIAQPDYFTGFSNFMVFSWYLTECLIPWRCVTIGISGLSYFHGIFMGLGF